MDDPNDGVPDFSARVRDFISAFEPFSPRLPLTHICPMFAFREIVGGASLNPQKCDVYNEDLTYLFYGRPAYRAKQNAYHRLKWSIPILFLLNPEETYSVRRVLPFDSGAFNKGMYGLTFAERSQVKDFELDPEIDSAQKFVTALYGNNKMYYAGESDKSLDLTDWDFELQGLDYLSKQPALQDPNSQLSIDERSSAVEIQISDPIDIGRSTLALFVPETLLVDPYFQTAITRWRLQPDQIEAYAGVVGPRSEAWVGQLYEKVRQFYDSRGFL